MNSHQPPVTPKPRKVGDLAEDLVAQWLVNQGWTVLHRQWHCRWGELDVIAQQDAIAPSSTQAALIFVEVKARSSGNWDANGLLAITPQKQAKLLQAAEIFLSTHPDLADLPCRFDVALVSSRRYRSANVTVPRVVELGKSVAIGGYALTLQHYIPGAFN